MTTVGVRRELSSSLEGPFVLSLAHLRQGASLKQHFLQEFTDKLKAKGPYTGLAFVALPTFDPRVRNVAEHVCFTDFSTLYPQPVGS